MSDIGRRPNRFTGRPACCSSLETSPLSRVTCKPWSQNPCGARMGAAAQRRVRQLFTVETMTAGFTGQIERLLEPGVEPGPGESGNTRSYLA